MSRNDDLKDLGNLPRETAPPPEIEERVVSALRREGLLGRARKRAPRGTRRRLATAASILVAALGGWVARGWADAAPPPPEGTREFLVLLSEPEALETTKSTAELVDEYRRWAGELASEGLLVSARRLTEGGVSLAAGLAAPAALSPQASQSQATGYFVIRAESLAGAVERVEDCPHLRYGGAISVREVARDG